MKIIRGVASRPCLSFCFHYLHLNRFQILTVMWYRDFQFLFVPSIDFLLFSVSNSLLLFIFSFFFSHEFLVSFFVFILNVNKICEK